MKDQTPEAERIKVKVEANEEIPENIQETKNSQNIKTRKFAETVLDTDTPPKDFVKLMHAGDESLKYTPKKNSELWNKAAKSVQESPERVFNELENTRVASDETMAKGIALAKHYQAVGDDLKASELYVELAKKATEAGRTVQALNLMRKTTPEGVLMSTMREVENYNDKMKNKPNKQINITPEQRAEFLGKLREAYAMPEGDLRKIAKTDEWRVQRIARTETHRAKGFSSIEAGVQIQNESGVRIWKEWVVVSGSPCGYCAAMNGKRINVAESYVKKGGILISKSKIRINNYEDIDTAGAHPNCSCVERFGIEEEAEELFDYSKLDPKDSEYMYPHEQDFYERLVKNFNNVERIPKSDFSTPTSDFTVNGDNWELKSILTDKLGKNTLRNEIFKATDKGKRNIFIDNYQEKHDIEKIIEMAKKHISIEKNDKLIDNLTVVSGSAFIKIK